MEPASANEVLRQREAVLQRCVQSLSATLEQWGAAVEAEPARLGAEAAQLDGSLDKRPLTHITHNKTSVAPVTASRPTGSRRL